MARYYNAPKNDIVDLTPRVPIEFYSKIMEQAQQNLNQANATGAAFMTDLYGIEHIDEAARNKAIAMGQEPIAQALDKDFVTPATIASAVSKASQLVNPWRNLNTKQVKEAKREQELRDKWGSNYIGNSVLSQKLYNSETGSWIKPEDIQLIAGNREDLVQALARDNAGRADLKREIEGNWRTILGGKAFEKKNTRVTGLTEAERVAEFVDNQNMAKQYLAQMPEFAKAIAASGIDPVDYMTKEINQWSKQLVKGEDYDSKYLDNPDYDPRGGDIVAPPIGKVKSTGFTTEIKKVTEDVDEVRDLLNYKPKSRNVSLKSDPSKGTVTPSGLINVGGTDAKGNEPYYRNPHPTEETFVEAQRKYKTLVSKYPHIENEVRQQLLSQGANRGKTPLEFHRLVQEGTLNSIKSKASENTLTSDFALDWGNAMFEKGLAREMSLNITRQNLGDMEVYSTSGKSIKLSDLFKKGTDDSEDIYAQPNASGSFSVYKDGTTYIIPPIDATGASTNIVNDEASKTTQLMSKVFTNQYKYTNDPKDPNNPYLPMDLGYNIPLNISVDGNTKTVVGNPVYYYKYENGRNNLYRAVMSSDGTPYTYKNKMIEQPIDIGQFQLDASTALNYQIELPTTSESSKQFNNVTY